MATNTSAAIAAAVAAAALVGGGALVANAATSPSPTPSQQQGYGMPGDGQGRGPGGPGGGNHTAVTGDELAKVTAAVKAKDSAVTVTRVMKDEDGSYDVFGTKAGANVMFNVSKDLATVAQNTMGGGKGGHGPGGPGGGNHTAVTGDELAKVTAAVKAKHSAVTVTRVMKDEDGSYDVFGTKAGANVMVEVSKDLKTIIVRTGGPGGHDGQAPGAPAGTQSGTGNAAYTA